MRFRNIVNGQRQALNLNTTAKLELVKEKRWMRMQMKKTGDCWRNREDTRVGQFHWET